MFNIFLSMIMALVAFESFEDGSVRVTEPNGTSHMICVQEQLGCTDVVGQPNFTLLDDGTLVVHLENGDVTHCYIGRNGCGLTSGEG
jgi:hypothetical protein